MRYGETVVNNWVRMQRATWDAAAGSVATRFVLKMRTVNRLPSGRQS